MKYLIFILLASCASPGISPYDQGCRDGIRRFDKNKVWTQEIPNYVDLFCASLDYENEGRKLQRERPGNGGNR